MVLNAKLKRTIVIFSAIFCLTGLFAKSVPALEGYVNDKAGIISNHTEQQISSYLKSLEDTTGIQIAVLTVPSLDGEDISSYSMKVCEKWQLGQKDKDNGALLLIAYEEHEVRIEAGYGLEDKLTDAKCGLIIRNVIIPEFKKGQYSDGILKGVQNIGGIASDNAELVTKTVRENDEEDDFASGIIMMIFWIIFFTVVISSKGGIFKWIILSNMMGGNHHGHYHSGSHHSSFGNSFGGSSFGGGSSFHGGSGHFGGGGASGHW